MLCEVWMACLIFQIFRRHVEFDRLMLACPRVLGPYQKQVPDGIVTLDENTCPCKIRGHDDHDRHDFYLNLAEHLAAI